MDGLGQKPGERREAREVQDVRRLWSTKNRQTEVKYTQKQTCRNH
jgi:hypothetical protein